MNLLKKIAFTLAVATILAACNSSQKVVYLQDIEPTSEANISNLNQIRIQPGDMLYIIVSCRDPQIAALFNLINPSQRLSSDGRTLGNNGEMGGYLVTPAGDIDFPQIGRIHVEGLTREEIAADIKDRLTKSDMVKDPVVTVDFMNLHFSVLGEVAHPGQYSISKDNLNILQALSQAGDLTIYGKRDNVQVIREKDGKRYTYTIDLRSKDLFNSPAYYLQQNDVIYVTPNNARAGQSTINDNSMKSTSFWVSIASVLTSMAVLIFK